jgi:succinate--hydroxymethylglutarate CoA-transferase
MNDEPSMAMSSQFWDDQESNLLTLTRAEVIKVEHPTRGDDTRAWGPPYASYVEGSGKKGPGEAAYFISVCPLMSNLQITLLNVFR